MVFLVQYFSYSEGVRARRGAREDIGRLCLCPCLCLSKPPEPPELGVCGRHSALEDRTGAAQAENSDGAARSAASDLRF